MYFFAPSLPLHVESISPPPFPRSALDWIWQGILELGVGRQSQRSMRANAAGPATQRRICQGWSAGASAECGLGADDSLKYGEAAGRVGGKTGKVAVQSSHVLLGWNLKSWLRCSGSY